MTTIDTVKAESEDLELHVELCAQRYEQLDSRLTNLENKVDAIDKKLDDNKTAIVKALIVTAGSIITTVIGTIVAVLHYLK